MTKIEELARIIAAAVTGLDPDARIVRGEPYRLTGLWAYALPRDYEVTTVWSQFEHAAEAAIAAGFDRPDPLPVEENSLVEVPAPKPGDTRFNGTAGLIERCLDNGEWVTVNNSFGVTGDWREQMGLD